MPRIPLHGSTCCLAVMLAACGPRQATEAAERADIVVGVASGRIIAPDSIAAGWHRIRVDEDGKGHIVVIFRLADSVEASAAAGFATALDSASATPSSAVALGGPEIGDTGEVVVELTPGRYVLACVRRGSDGHRHSSAGEARQLRVTAATDSGSTRAAPVATARIRMTDFAYPGTDTLRAGEHLLRVENDGRQDHQLRISRLRDGSSLRDWLDSEGGVATPVAGIARLGPGQVAFLPVTLPAGSYVLHCLVPDPATGKPHVALGMFRELRVRAPRT